VAGVGRWAAALMAHGGAPPRLLLLHERGARRESGAGGGTEWRLGARGAVPTGVSRSASGASTTSAYGGHVVGAGWSEAGIHAWERGEGRRVGPAAPVPFSFFFEFLFSINFPNSF